jgi:hypothetical protein
MGWEGTNWVNLSEDRNKLRSVMRKVKVRYDNETDKCT